MILRTVRGIEWLVADEATSLCPGSSIAMDRREVRIDAAPSDPRIMRLSTADDALALVGDVHDVGHTRAVLRALAERVAALDVGAAARSIADVRPLPARPTFDVVASLAGQRNYSRFELEDALGAHLSESLGGRFRSRAEGAQPEATDLTVRVILTGSVATVALRLSGTPLHRRPWKSLTGAGSLHPPLAAAMVRLAEIGPGARVADPFCGDGTIAVEASLNHPTARVQASDIDPARLSNAQANASRAGVSIDLSLRDAGHAWPSDEPIDAIVTNPPWNVAVEGSGTLSGSLDRFWEQAEAGLSRHGRIVVLSAGETKSFPGARHHGLVPLLAQRLRVAGHVAWLTVLGRAETAPLAERLAQMRRRAERQGLISGEDF